MKTQVDWCRYPAKARGVMPWLLCVPVLIAGYPSLARACIERIEFNIPSERFDEAVVRFAQQAEVSVLFPVYSTFQGVRTNALVGTYCIEEGLSILFENTPVIAMIDESRLLTFAKQEALTTAEAGGNEMSRNTSKSSRNFLASAIAAVFAGGVGG